MIKQQPNQNIASDNLVFLGTLIQSPKHKISLSERVADLAENQPEVFQELLTAVRTYKAWTPDNDPYGEKDFGKVRVANRDYYFKIDLYDSTWEHGWDPDSGQKPNRLLTLMRTEEY